MADHSEFNQRRAWSRGWFDIEGLAGALAALLFGIFAGAFWYPLFIIGFLAAGVVLAATRRVDRTLPEGAFHVLAPCDGVVSQITQAVPPSELQMGSDEITRIRISSSPLSPNPLFAPVTGEVTASVHEDGEPSQIFASRPDVHGLTAAYLTIGSGSDAVGLKVMTGGFGPRLDIEIDAHDMLRAGRKFGKRRLGGWCDVYLPEGMEAAVWAGQTLVGGETELAARVESWVVKQPDIPDLEEEPEGEPERELTLEDIVAETEPETPEDTSARLFERLRREAQGIEDED